MELDVLCAGRLRLLVPLLSPSTPTRVLDVYTVDDLTPSFTCPVSVALACRSKGCTSSDGLTALVTCGACEFCCCAGERTPTPRSPLDEGCIEYTPLTRGPFACVCLLSVFFLFLWSSLGRAWPRICFGGGMTGVFFASRSISCRRLLPLL